MTLLILISFLKSLAAVKVALLPLAKFKLIYLAGCFSSSDAKTNSAPVTATDQGQAASGNAVQAKDQATVVQRSTINQGKGHAQVTTGSKNTILASGAANVTGNRDINVTTNGITGDQLAGLIAAMPQPTVITSPAAATPAPVASTDSSGTSTTDAGGAAGATTFWAKLKAFDWSKWSSVIYVLAVVLGVGFWLAKRKKRA